MDVPPSTPWKDRLRQERIRRNWRQQDLADRLATTVVTVQRWERGSQRPSAYFRVKLCALFDKSAEELGLLPIAAPDDNGSASPPAEIPSVTSGSSSLEEIPREEDAPDAPSKATASPSTSSQQQDQPTRPIFLTRRGLLLAGLTGGTLASIGAGLWWFRRPMTCNFNTSVAHAAYSEPRPPSQSLGSSNDWVQVIQFKLNALHFEGRVSFSHYPLVTDKNFGPDTKGAVEAYQKNVMQVTDGGGVVGDRTWSSLGFCTGFLPCFDLTGSHPHGSHYPGTLSYGNCGTWVRALQQALNADASNHLINRTCDKDSWWPLKVDGIFGVHTEHAVKSFQAANHLTPNGIVGNRTWQAMGMCYT